MRVHAPAAKAAAAPTKKTGGAAARKALVERTPVPHVRSATKIAARSLADGRAAGVQNGGSGTGAGAGEGTGGLAGAGSGNGSSGNGNGDDKATAPCGAVIFEPGHLSYRRDGTVVQQVFAKVVLRDGSVNVALFPYPFVYPGAKDNPFVHDEALNGHDGVTLQFPPAGTATSDLPPVIQTVLHYTDGRGITTLPACPGGNNAF